MSNDLVWKILLILAVIAVSAWLVYPPSETIALGLDLSGGARILMQVDASSAVANQRDLALTRIGQGLKDEGIVYDTIRSTGEATLEIVDVEAASVDAAEELLERWAGDWSVSKTGSGSWRLTMPLEAQAYHAENAINTTVETLRNRVDAMGLREPNISRQGAGGRQILVELPGVENINQVKDAIGEPALLEWKKVSYPEGNPNVLAVEGGRSEAQVIGWFGGVLPDDTAIYAREEAEFRDRSFGTMYWPLKRISTVVGDDLRDARRDFGGDFQQEQVVSFELAPEASKRFEDATREYVGKRMAILLDKKVISAPVIEGVIPGGRGVISGGFTVESAETLSVQLRSGALPASVEIIEERTIGPSLGRDSIEAGIKAILFGFVGVLLFMVFYYRLSGINAVVALALNVVIILGAMAALKATLTLPGIAGLVLVVGMAVDSNVLIFERIREELRVGKTVRSAVDQGFSRAFLTILDCNVTTLIAALALLLYGTGPVRGFAVTLIIGLIASMFTAVFVSRQIFEIVLGRKRKVESLSI